MWKRPLTKRQPITADSAVHTSGYANSFKTMSINYIKKKETTSPTRYFLPSSQFISLWHTTRGSAWVRGQRPNWASLMKIQLPFLSGWIPLHSICLTAVLQLLSSTFHILSCRLFHKVRVKVISESKLLKARIDSGCFEAYATMQWISVACVFMIFQFKGLSLE